MNENVNSKQILFECAKSEYLRECERERIIENKAQIFIGILTTFTALIIQKIPYEKLSQCFMSQNIWVKYSIILSAIVIFTPLFIILFMLVSIINIKPHSRFRIDELKNEKLINSNEDTAYTELTNHYYKILKDEEKQNEDLAKKLKILVILSIMVIVILVIVILILNTLFGGN